MEFNRNILELNKAVECGKVSEFIAHHVHEMKRDGIIVGLSGGIDSAVAAALCVKAVGPEKVVGLILPEKDSNPLSAEYAAAQAKKLGIETETVDLTPVLQAFGTYEKRDEVVRDIFPQYNENWKMK
ncbi:MAG: NAD(+) synthase, partial [bacterium]|nr:NAD(+) synthase [bacterium]